MILTIDTQVMPTYELRVAINMLIDVVNKRDKGKYDDISNKSAPLADQDGPGEKDGPWAEGWEQRTSQFTGVEGKVSLGVTPIITGGNDEFEPDDEDDVSASNVTHVSLVDNPPDPACQVSPAVPPPPPSEPQNFHHLGCYQVANAGTTQSPPPATVTPPPASNPEVTGEVSTSANEGVELDSDGLPWDASIHSESRAKNVDGTWRKRRVTKNVEVKQSIRGLEAITPNSVPAPPTTARKTVTTMVRINGAQNVIKAPEGATDEELSVITGQPTVRERSDSELMTTATTKPVIPPPPAAAAVPTAPQVPPPPPAAAAPVPIKTAPQGSPVGTFKELMERITTYFSTQQITSQDLAVICATFGIPNVQHCFTKPELVGQVGAAIDGVAETRVPR